MACRIWGRMLMRWQRAPGLKEKIQSTLSWLRRLNVEGSAAGNGGEPKQLGILFEYVSLMDCERVRILTLNSPELSKESKTSYSPCRRVPAWLVIRKAAKTCRPYVDSPRTSGTPSLSTRSVLILQYPQDARLRRSAGSSAKSAVRPEL